LTLSRGSPKFGLGRDRAHRTDINAGLAFITGAFPLFKDPIETDPSVKTSLGKIHLRPAFLGSANPHAPSAQNAPVGVIIEEGMVFHHGGFFEQLLKAPWFESHAEEFGHVLESALLVRGTVSAIHIMNREQKPKSASLQISYCRRVGLDNQRCENPDGAGRNRLSVDFNEAQPARGIRMLHAFKIAEVRDINAVTQAGFEQNSALLNFNLFMVYQNLDHETLMPLSPWQGAQSPEPGEEGRPS
jgi:hypothetical protein